MQLQKSNGNTARGPVEPYPSGGYWTQLLLPMQRNKESRSGSDPDREQFTTIDDLVHMAGELFSGLKNLSERRHPMDIRRGLRKEVGDVKEQDEHSKTVKAGSRTYFFDVKETKEGKPYLVITESRFKGEGEGRERSTIVVFQENAGEFADAVSVMTDKLG